MNEEQQVFRETAEQRGRIKERSAQADDTMPELTPFPGPTTGHGHMSLPPESTAAGLRLPQASIDGPSKHHPRVGDAFRELGAVADRIDTLNTRMQGNDLAEMVPDRGGMWKDPTTWAEPAAWPEPTTPGNVHGESYRDIGFAQVETPPLRIYGNISLDGGKLPDGAYTLLQLDDDIRLLEAAGTRRVGLRIAPRDERGSPILVEVFLYPDGV